MSWDNPEEGNDWWDTAWTEDNSNEYSSYDFDYNTTGFANLGENLWGDYDETSEWNYGEADMEWYDDEGDEWYDDEGGEWNEETGENGEWYVEAGDY